MPAVSAAHPHGAPEARSDDEILKRDMLGHAMLLTLRGVPTIYSGDEQGFAGKGGDQDARAGHVRKQGRELQSTKRCSAPSATTATSNFNSDHPLYREIAELARIRTSHRALTRGLQLHPLRIRQARPVCRVAFRSEQRRGKCCCCSTRSTAPIHQNVASRPVRPPSTHWPVAVQRMPARPAP